MGEDEEQRKRKIENKAAARMGAGGQGGLCWFGNGVGDAHLTFYFSVGIISETLVFEMPKFPFFI